MDGVISSIVAPAAGMVIGNIMFATSITAVLTAQKKGSLGALNMVPYPLVTMNCVGWTLYALLKDDLDHFMFFGNAPGILFGVYFLCAALALADATKDKSMIALATYGMLLLLLALLAMAYLALFLSPGILRQGTGIFAVTCSCIYYTSPLATLATVFREWDSSSLHAPMCIMNLFNGFCWAVYGFATQDFLVAGPNLFGALLGGIQVALCLVLPRRQSGSTSPPTQAIRKPNASPDTDGEYTRLEGQAPIFTSEEPRV